MAYRNAHKTLETYTFRMQKIRRSKSAVNHGEGAGGGLSTCNSVWDNVNELSHRANTQSGHEKYAARCCLILDVATVRLSSATDKKSCVEIKETNIRGTENRVVSPDRRFKELLK